MTPAEEMLSTHPRALNVDRATLVECIEACFACAQSCTSCADACLGEDHVGLLVRCVRLCLDCSDTCIATGRVVTRQTEFDADEIRPIVEACATACRSCAEECERHAHHHEHCSVCAEACRRCENACAQLVSMLTVT